MLSAKKGIALFVCIIVSALKSIDLNATFFKIQLTNYLYIYLLLRFILNGLWYLLFSSLFSLLLQKSIYDYEECNFDEQLYIINILKFLKEVDGKTK